MLKIHEGRPNVGDLLRNRDIALLVVSSNGDAMDLADGRDIRRLALSLKVPPRSPCARAVAMPQRDVRHSLRITHYGDGPCPVFGELSLKISISRFFRCIGSVGDDYVGGKGDSGGYRRHAEREAANEGAGRMLFDFIIRIR